MIYLHWTEHVEADSSWKKSTKLERTVIIMLICQFIGSVARPVTYSRWAEEAYTPKGSCCNCSHCILSVQFPLTQLD